MRVGGALLVIARIAASMLVGCLLVGSTCMRRTRPDDTYERRERDGLTASGTPCSCEAFCLWDGPPCEWIDDCFGDICTGGHWDCGDGAWLCENETCWDADERFLEPEQCV